MQIISKFECSRTMRITAWILGFENKKNRHKYSRPLTVEELTNFY